MKVITRKLTIEGDGIPGYVAHPGQIKLYSGSVLRGAREAI